VSERHHEDGTGSDALAYEYKSSLIGAPFEFRLAPDALHWAKGGLRGSTRYAKIRRIRLGFRPLTMHNHRFVAEVWTDGPKLVIASTSWKSMFEQEQRSAAYRGFVTELCQRVGAAGGSTLFQTGSPPLIYWPGLIIFAAALLAIAALIVRALQAETWGSAAFVAAFFALFLWQGGTFFRRNRPGRLDPAAVPDSVLPRG
jgi:hypothetical protein